MSDEKESELPELPGGIRIEEAWTPGDVVYYGPASRSLALYGEICRESALVIISQILELENRAIAPIRIHLNTDGGSLADALAIYDCIRSIESPVVIVATGTCASAGLVILSAAEVRLATEHTIFFYHQAILPPEAISSFEQIDSNHAAYQLCQTTYDGILKERSKMTKTMYKKEFLGRTSKYFTSEEAYKYKLLDGIIAPRKKKMKIDME